MIVIGDALFSEEKLDPWYAQQGLTAEDTRANRPWGALPDVRRADLRMSSA